MGTLNIVKGLFWKNLIFGALVLNLGFINQGQTRDITIGVIDSGVDIEHRDFVNSIWINPDEIAGNWRDDDGNLYPDDVYGWNFAENNPFVIDRKYIGTFSNDVERFFEIQGKLFFGTASEEEITWMKEQRENKKFIQELSVFGNFVHGTHVAGITLKENMNAKVLTIKLIPTKVSPFFEEARKQQKKASFIEAGDNDWREKLMLSLFTMIASQQKEQLEKIVLYLNEKKVDIANGSFGSGQRQLSKTLTDTLFKILHFRKPTEEESKKTVKMLLDLMIKEMQVAFAKAPNTLFVFAAGNEASDNDAIGTSPANINLENSISVGATYNDVCFAPFSNFGAKTVDVAAPGMIINSQIPDNKYMKVSGTSQAAPFVTNIAAQIKEMNESLTPKQIKSIIMNTVDVKPFLTDKTLTKGLVNMNRAVKAAKLSVDMPIEAAINMAKKQVKDVEMKSEYSCKNSNQVVPMDLFPQFSK